MDSSRFDQFARKFATVTLQSSEFDSAANTLALEAAVLGGPMLSTPTILTPGASRTLRGGSLFVDDASLGSSDSCAGANDPCGHDEDTGQTIQGCSGQNLTCAIFTQSCGSDITNGCTYTYSFQFPPPTNCAKKNQGCGQQQCCSGLMCSPEEIGEGSFENVCVTA